ncbi:disease resistance protein [Salix suchowensis]|nr:disease resistance protein [Salix suchowensis]
MVRPNDPFWDYVEKMTGGLLKCMFCEYIFAAATSISRIKSHLAGVKGRGINVCAKVPKETQAAAYLAIYGTKKKRKTMPGSSSNGVASMMISTSSQQEKKGSETLARYLEDMLMEVESTDKKENRSAGELLQLVKMESSLEGNIVDSHETSGNALPRTDLVGQSIEKDWHEIYGLSMEKDDLNCGRENMAGDLIPEGVHETRGDAWLTTELLGQAFERNTDDVWSLLNMEQVLTIGVCGMGGMGKTTLVMHIHNLLLERPNCFRHVYWITKVGIPIGARECKLILTTRSSDVCKRMGCLENVVKLEPLSKDEAWSLFAKELGNYDINVEPLAKLLASECAGLPLGIKTLARSMRGVEDAYVWSKVLEEWEESKPGQSSMELEVFRMLKFSYIHLNDSSLQQCLLYCALIPEDLKVNRNDLIESLIVERIIEATGSRQSQFDKGHSMLNKLEGACLLESFITEDYRYVKMHDLIRDMALQIMSQEPWMKLEIPSNISQSCPKLATLLLCRNYKLELITDTFLKQLCELKVLDLSFTAIQELPGSISSLVCLAALLLRGCYKMRHMLDFCYATLEDMGFRSVEVEEVAGSRKLESLKCHFYNLIDFNKILQQSLEERQLLEELLYNHCHLMAPSPVTTIEVINCPCIKKVVSFFEFFDKMEEIIAADEGRFVVEERNSGSSRSIECIVYCIKQFPSSQPEDNGIHSLQHQFIFTKDSFTPCFSPYDLCNYLFFPVELLFL